MTERKLHVTASKSDEGSEDTTATFLSNPEQATRCSCRDKKVPTLDGPASSAHSATADSDAPTFLRGNANGLPLHKVNLCISLQGPSLLLLAPLPNSTYSGWNRLVPRVSSFGKFQSKLSCQI